MNFHTHTVAGYSKSLHYAIFVISGAGVVAFTLHLHFKKINKKLYIYLQVHLNKLECCEKVHFFL